MQILKLEHFSANNSALDNWQNYVWKPTGFVFIVAIDTLWKKSTNFKRSIL